MPVKRLEIVEFGAFAKASLEFADGLNVFVGANGTGKTHVMKLMYAVLATARAPGEQAALFRSKLLTKLAGVFRPDGSEVGRLVRRKQGLNTAVVRLYTGPRETAGKRPSERLAASFRLHTKGKLTAQFEAGAVSSRSIFLPTREVLAMYEGFISSYTERELSFDETYFDACVALNGSPLRGAKKKTAEKLATRLQEALGGHAVLDGGRFYVKFDQGGKMEAHLVAEGLRKIASLERLVLNGSLMKHGHLFWDEPEANLNPKLIVVVADVLAELARYGIQVFLTTHDYLLARRLSLLTRKPGSPPTRFFAFYRPESTAPVEVRHGDTLSDLPPDNPMVQEFTNLYDLEMEVAAQG